jgi:hypothetical protein
MSQRSQETDRVNSQRQRALRNPLLIKFKTSAFSCSLLSQNKVQMDSALQCMLDERVSKHIDYDSLNRG